MNKRGFTLIELLVTIAIIAVLSAIILFSISQYISRSKDASIAGNLSILIPAGEAYYDRNGSNGYGTGKNSDGVISGDGDSFCGSSVVKNSFSQIGSARSRYCSASKNLWVACAIKFTDNPSQTKAFYVDSRGVKKEIDSGCDGNITIIP